MARTTASFNFSRRSVHCAVPIRDRDTLGPSLSASLPCKACAPARPRVDTQGVRQPALKGRGQGRKLLGTGPPSRGTGRRSRPTTCAQSEALPPAPPGPAQRLRALLAAAKADKRCLLVPACHDAMSAVLIERAGFEVAFMSGYAVSAMSAALPDAGLLSYGEMLDAGRRITAAVTDLCVIGDGDTGFGNAANVRRAIEGYASAGFAGISIEDQVYPKRCAYAAGLRVVAQDEAAVRVRAAIAARNAHRRRTGQDLVIIARTDCRHAAEHGGMVEVLKRCMIFESLGADIVYAEGLEGEDEMRQLNEALGPAIIDSKFVSGTPTMLAQVEQPGKALVSADHAAQLGYSLSLMGLTVVNVAMRAMKDSLSQMASGDHPGEDRLLPFDDLYSEVGFDDFNKWSQEHDL